MLVNIYGAIFGNKLSKEILFTIFARFLIISINFIVGVILARNFGPTALGIYALLYAIITTITLPSSSGVGTLLLRETSASIANKNYSSYLGLVRWAKIIITIFISLSLLAALGVRNIFITLKDSNYDVEYSIALFAIALLSINTVLEAFLRGLGQTALSQLSLIFRQLIFLATTLAVLIFTTFDVSKILLAYLISVLISTIIQSTFIQNNKPNTKLANSIKVKWIEWTSAILPLTLMAGIQLINNRADILMVGIFRSSHDVGLYEVAMRGSEVTYFFAVAIYIAIASRISKLYTTSNYYELSLLVRRIVLIINIISLPLIALMYFFSEEVIWFIFGEQYLMSTFALRVLVISHAVNIVMGPAILVLNMTGNEKISLKIVAMAAIINLILNYLLIPIYGINGACIATASSTLVWSISSAYMVKRILGINTTLLGLKFNRGNS